MEQWSCDCCSAFGQVIMTVASFTNGRALCSDMFYNMSTKHARVSFQKLLLDGPITLEAHIC